MANLREIALAAGVSIRTVSRVLTKNGYVGAKTRARVEATVGRVGYQPNLAARSLKTARSHIVSVMAFTTDELRMAQVAALEQTLRGAGYVASLVFHLDTAHLGKAREVLLEMIERRPAGVVVLGHEIEITRRIFPKLIPVLKNSGLPFVILDPKGLAEKWTRTDAVTIDRGRGVLDAVQHLAARGAKRIAYLGPREDRTRLDGYELALKQLGRPCIFLDYPGTGAAALRAMGRAISRQKGRPDAVVAHSDHIAMAFLAGLHDAGLRVPEDMAVIGFDDRPAAKLAWPALTTIAQPIEEVGRAAAEILLAKMNGHQGTPVERSRCFPARLVVRETA